MYRKVQELGVGGCDKCMKKCLELSHGSQNRGCRFEINLFLNFIDLRLIFI